MKKDDLLLVIDMQNVYLPDQEWACPAALKISERIKEVLLANVAAEVIFTEFRAPQDAAGCWKQYNEEYRAINENVFLNQLIELLKEIASEYTLLSKSTYSSMRIPEVREAALKRKRIVLTGVVAECCVLATMLEAIDDGCKVVYLTDCIAGQNAENEAMILRLAESFSPIHVQVMDSLQYLKEDLE